jgi:succinate-acetate transporter protein
MAQEMRAGAAPAIADPAPLGLAGFALTTFVLSAHNAGWAPDIVWIGLAIFYGGLAQFMAGMWSFRRGNVFTATAFSTYGAFWFSLATYVLLVVFLKAPVKGADVTNSLGWFLLAFAIFNTYMMFWAARINLAVFLVFLTLEITEILLFIGFFNGSGAGEGLVLLGGLVGILTAAVAFYTSAADVVSNMAGGRALLPVGKPLWTESRRRG